MGLARATGVILALSLMAAFAAEAGTVYRWTDAQGRVHFGDEPPPGSNRGERVSLPDSAAPRSAPSPRVQRIRCRDFRTALVALQDVDDVPRDDPRLIKAKRKARSGIEHWCS